MRHNSDRINRAIGDLIDAMNADNASGVDNIKSISILLARKDVVGVVTAGCSCPGCLDMLLDALQQHISGEPPVAEYTHEIHRRH
ncbi:MAG: hypothetical protein PHX82_04915 [Paracoccaceae bacterium]|nr:hypothetical protein [Paracoccaceae bacterium]